MKHPIKKHYQRRMAVAVLSLMTLGISAQQRYSFHCGDYVSTDDSRAPQSAFSYNENANTFTVKASGTNNVAFKMSSEVDGNYYISNEQYWFTIHATNVSTTLNDSRIWWFNGYNNGAQSPTRVIANSDGSQLLLWNIKASGTMGTNMDFTQQKIAISSHSNGFIHAIGLTSGSGDGTISDVNYYAPYELAAIYPALRATMGYDATTLTTKLLSKTDSLMAVAENKLAGTINSKLVADSLQKADAEVKEAVATLGKSDYSGAYTLYKKMDGSIIYFDNNNHKISYTKTDNGITGVCDSLSVKVVFYTDGIVRVYKSYLPTEQKTSLCVVKQPETGIALTYKDYGDSVAVSSSMMTAVYTLNTGHVGIHRKSGESLINENSFSMVPVMDGVNNSYSVRQAFSLDANEDIYGMGQIQNGLLSQRNLTYYNMSEGNRTVFIPYFQSTKGYSVFWDNCSPTTFIDNSISTSFQSTGTEIDYYVMTGVNNDSVLRDMRTLTGNCPMPALWNFGLYQSKERYQSAAEVINVVRKYRSLKVPLDCIVQDWQYWGDDAHWNAMSFLNSNYSNYARMIDYVHDNNAKLMISIWANFGPKTDQYTELNALGRLIPVSSYPTDQGVLPYDCYSTTARDIYWKYLYNGLASKGIDAYWMDSSEPDYFGNGTTDYDYLSENGATWRSMRNAFPLCHVGGVYEHHRAQTDMASKRVSILTRSAFAGQQRYGANTWNGDMGASWEVLANCIPAACNFSVAGNPYWNSDIGGFFTDGFTGADDSSYRSLYCRWVQFGAFCPMMRFHGTTIPREIYQFGSKGDSKGDYDRILKYILIRYRMLPYLYSTAWQVSTNGQTFMQALPVAFGSDTACRSVKDEYMFGKSFLVAPVVKDNADSRDVYLPKDVKWIDFWTGTTVSGGVTVTKATPEDILPLYVPAGTILPWGPDVQYSTEKQWDSLEVRVYPGDDGAFTLYEDENDSYNYENGAYTEIPFTWNDATMTLTIGKRNGSFTGMLSSRVFNITLVKNGNGTGDAHATTFNASVKYTGDAMSVSLSTDGVAQATAVGSGLDIAIVNNTVALTSDKKQTVDIFDTVGKSVGRVCLNKGVTRTVSLAKGNYIIGGQSVLLK